MFKAKKVIVHSMASPWLLLFLFLFPRLNKKVYWVIWGKDLYFFKLLNKKHFYHHIYEFFRKRVLKKIKHVVTYVNGDFKLAKKWYGTQATYHECLMYPSNLYKEGFTTQTQKDQTLTIQVGNSADPSNQHFFILDTLKPFKDENIMLVIPLSYGNSSHGRKVAARAQSIYQHKCTPLESFLPYDDYIKLLNQIDVAIFAHNRQQAMGNIISLLGLGKKVYLNNQTTSFELFNSIGLKLFSLSEINIKPISIEDQNNNKQIIKNYFNAEKLKMQWQEIFEID